MGVLAAERSAGQHQVGQSEQREQLRRVFGQTTIPDLAMTEQAFDDVETMLDLGALARLGLLQFLFDAAQFVVLERLAQARAHRGMPFDIGADVFSPFAHALVAGVAEHDLLCAVQQRVRLRDVSGVAGRADDRVHQTRGHVDANMSLHAEIPFVALLGLVHFRIAFAIAVLGRWRRGDQSGVNDGALAHRQAFAGQMAVDFAEDALGQFMLLKQPPELQQRRRVGRRFMGQIDADKAADGLAVVDGIFDAFVRQAEALLGDVHPEHPFKTDRRTAAPITLRVVRQQRRHQRRPWRGRFDLGKKTVAPRQLLFTGVLGVGKARLHGVCRGKFDSHILPASLGAGEQPQE